MMPHSIRPSRAALLLALSLAACSTTGDGPVGGKPTPALTLQLSGAPDTVFVEQTFPFRAVATTGTLARAALAWVSADTTIASVAADGRVTGKATGVTTIRVVSGTASAAKVVQVAVAPILATGLAWNPSTTTLRTVDSAAVPVVLQVADAGGTPRPLSRLRFAVQDTFGVFRVDSLTGVLSMRRNGWARGQVVVTLAGSGAVVARQDIKSTGWLARVIFGASVPATAKAEFAAAWAVWAERVQDTLPTRTRTFDPAFTFGNRDGLSDAMIADSARNSNRVLVLVEYGSFRTTSIVAIAGNLRQNGVRDPVLPSVSMTMQLNSDVALNWDRALFTRSTIAHELGHGHGIGAWGRDGRSTTLTPLLQPSVVAPGQSASTGAQFVGPRATAFLRSLGLTPAWWPGVPLNETAHWAVGGQKELMSRVSGDDAVATTLDFLALADLGYRMDVNNAPSPAFVFEPPWN
jgi:hypothetical protein